MSDEPVTSIMSAEEYAVACAATDVMRAWIDKSTDELRLGHNFTTNSTMIVVTATAIAVAALSRIAVGVATVTLYVVCGGLCIAVIPIVFMTSYAAQAAAITAVLCVTAVSGVLCSTLVFGAFECAICSRPHIRSLFEARHATFVRSVKDGSEYVYDTAKRVCAWFGCA
jgi:hypothetical protein